MINTRCRRCGSRLEFWMSIQADYCTECRCEVRTCCNAAAGEFGRKYLCLDHLLDGIEIFKYDEHTTKSVAARAAYKRVLYQQWAAGARIRAVATVIMGLYDRQPPIE